MVRSERSHSIRRRRDSPSLVSAADFLKFKDAQTTHLRNHTAADCAASLWNVSTMKHEMTYSGHSQGINDVCFSPDDRYVLTCSDDKTLRIYDAKSGTCVRELKGHTSFVFCAKFSPHMNLIASGSFDECVRLWDTRTGACLRVIQAHSEPITSVDFSHDGTLLLSSSHDGLCRIWDVVTAQCLKTLVGDENTPASFSRFSPNSKFVLTSTLNGNIRLWNCATSKFHKTYTGHINNRHSISTAFDLRKGQFVVTGSEDGKVYVYDVQSQKCLSELTTTTTSGVVMCVETGKCKSLMASVTMESSHSTIILWKYKEVKE